MKRHGHHIAVAVAVLISCVLGGASSAAQAPARDWTKHPVVVQVDTKQDIWAIGDAHGDPTRLAAALAGAGLIADAKATPDKVDWTGGKAVLVMTGDLIDKGTDSLGVIALLDTLRQDAESKGGQVIVTMGNHEAEFLADPTGKKTSEFSAELTHAGYDPKRVGACGGKVGKFLCDLPIAARVGDWFFAHGGNTAGRSIAALTSAIEAGVAKDGFATDELVGDDSILEARLNKKGPGGLPWFDQGTSSTNPQTVLAGYAANLGVAHIVQGHQYEKVEFPDGNDRKAYRFFQRYGLLFLIDTGMSRGIDGSDSIGGVLHISADGPKSKAVVVCPDGSTKTLWSDSKTDDQSAHCP